MRVGRYINEVCQLLDVRVLCDIDMIPWVAEVKAGGSVDFKIRTMVALGWNAEPDAGIRYGTVTRWFANEDELDEFCELNINRFHIAAAECVKGAAVPDATEWR